MSAASFYFKESRGYYSQLENVVSPAQLPGMRIGGRSISIMLRGLMFPVLCARLSAAVMSFSAVADTSMFEANPDYDLGGRRWCRGRTSNIRGRGRCFVLIWAHFPLERW